jgi:hypothetical protein
MSLSACHIYCMCILFYEYIVTNPPWKLTKHNNTTHDKTYYRDHEQQHQQQKQQLLRY